MNIPLTRSAAGLQMWHWDHTWPSTITGSCCIMRTRANTASVVTFPWWSVQLSDLVEEHLQWSHSRAKDAASDRQLCGNFGRSSLVKFNRWQQREDIEQCSRLEMKQPTIQSLIFWFQGSFWNKKLVKEYLENISQCLFKLSWIKMYQLNNYSFPS